MASRLNRRTFLRSGGVALSLPLLDAMLPRLRAAGASARPPKRVVFACCTLGIHGPNLFPTKTGADYEPTPYLEPLAELRNQFTVFSGLSHPEQAGANGHSSEMTWLTSARNPGLTGFRNTVSIDQLLAEMIGYETRYPSLVLSTSNGSQSYTRSGVMIPADSKPSQVFAKLFLDGTPEQVKAEVRNLREGRSIMDAVRDEAARLSRRVGTADRAKLDEYFTSVREMEHKLLKAEEGVHRPKPKVDAAPPQDITNEADLIGRIRLLFDLIAPALQTDSTRVLALTLHGRGDVPLVPGVSIDHHNLSHHGQEPEKLKQLRLVEEAHMRAFADLLKSLAAKDEAGSTMLDNTMVLLGSNLGNANSHDWHNLPIILAGGGFRHGGHTAFDPKNNRPLADLFVQMAQQMDRPIEQFGSSTGRSVL